MALSIMRRSKGAESRGSQLNPESLGNLRELATIVLRRAVYTVLNNESIEEKLRESMQRLCQLAQNHQVTAEGLVVVMKDIWWEMPEVERALKDRREEVLSRVVTLCINEYFALKKD